MGGFVSALGSGASAVAFPLLVLATTGSPAQAGIAGFARLVAPLLVLAPAGVLLDRGNRRTAMVAAALLGAAAIGSIAVALVAGALTFGHILVAAFAQGVASGLFAVSESSAIGMVVEPSRVREAIARNELRRGVADIAGPPLGGALFGVARALPFVVDAVSSLAAALAVALVRTPLQEPRDDGPRASLIAELWEGLRFLWSLAFVRVTILAVSAANLIWGGIEIVLVVRATGDGASPAQVGVMFMLFSAGAVAGALAAPRAVARLRTGTIVVGAFWIEALAVGAMTLTTSPYALGAIAAVAAAPAASWNAVVSARRLELTPDRLQGRVIAAGRTLAGAMLPLGALAGGALAGSAGTTTTLAAFAGWQVLVAAATTASATIRREG